MFRYKSYVVTFCAFCGSKYFYNEDFSIVNEKTTTILIREIESSSTSYAESKKTSKTEKFSQQAQSSTLVSARQGAVSQAEPRGRSGTAKVDITESRESKVVRETKTDGHSAAEKSELSGMARSGVGQKGPKSSAVEKSEMSQAVAGPKTKKGEDSGQFISKASSMEAGAGKDSGKPKDKDKKQPEPATAVQSQSMDAEATSAKAPVGGHGRSGVSRVDITESRETKTHRMTKSYKHHDQSAVESSAARQGSDSGKQRSQSTSMIANVGRDDSKSKLAAPKSKEAESGGRRASSVGPGEPRGRSGTAKVDITESRESKVVRDTKTDGHSADEKSELSGMARSGVGQKGPKSSAVEKSEMSQADAGPKTKKGEDSGQFISKASSMEAGAGKDRGKPRFLATESKAEQSSKAAPASSGTDSTVMGTGKDKKRDASEPRDPKASKRGSSSKSDFIGSESASKAFGHKPDEMRHGSTSMAKSKSIEGSTTGGKSGRGSKTDSAQVEITESGGTRGSGSGKSGQQRGRSSSVDAGPPMDEKSDVSRPRFVGSKSKVIDSSSPASSADGSPASSKASSPASAASKDADMDKHKEKKPDSAALSKSKSMEAQPAGSVPGPRRGPSGMAIIDITESKESKTIKATKSFGPPARSATDISEMTQSQGAKSLGEVKDKRQPQPGPVAKSKSKSKEAQATSSGGKDKDGSSSSKLDISESKDKSKAPKGSAVEKSEMSQAVAGPKTKKGEDSGQFISKASSMEAGAGKDSGKPKDKDKKQPEPATAVQSQSMDAEATSAKAPVGGHGRSGVSRVDITESRETKTHRMTKSYKHHDQSAVESSAARQGSDSGKQRSQSTSMIANVGRDDSKSKLAAPKSKEAESGGRRASSVGPGEPRGRSGTAKVDITESRESKVVRDTKTDGHSADEKSELSGMARSGVGQKGPKSSAVEKSMEVEEEEAMKTRRKKKKRVEETEIEMEVERQRVAREAAAAAAAAAAEPGGRRTSSADSGARVEQSTAVDASATTSAVSRTAKTTTMAKSPRSPRSPRTPRTPGGRRRTKFRYTTTTTTLTAERQRQEERRQREAAEAAAVAADDAKRKKKKQQDQRNEASSTSSGPNASTRVSDSISVNLANSKSSRNGPKPSYEEYEKKRKKKEY